MRQLSRTVIDPVKVDFLKEREEILSDRQLAKAANINANTLTNVVRKGRSFDSKTLDSLAKALRCNPIDLQTVVEDAPELFSPAVV